MDFKKTASIVLLFIAVVSLGLLLPPKTSTVKLYYYNPNLDKDEEGSVLCSQKGLEPVLRTIAKTPTLLSDTIELLLLGNLTDAEKSSGVTTEYPLPSFRLLQSDLNEGVLTLTFDDPDNKSSGGSCRAAILWFQIEATALQFNEVKEVHFKPEWIFQP